MVGKIKNEYMDLKMYGMDNFKTKVRCVQKRVLTHARSYFTVTSTSLPTCKFLSRFRTTCFSLPLTRVLRLDRKCALGSIPPLFC